VTTNHSNISKNVVKREAVSPVGHIVDGTRPRQTAELASLFPEVHSEIAWQASQGLLELDCSNSENNANETKHFSDRDIDLTEFGYDRYEAQRISICFLSSERTAIFHRQQNGTLQAMPRLWIGIQKILKCCLQKILI
jgi:hypothetical protein